MPDKHNPFGGSTIDRTLHCAAWRSLADTLPKPPPSAAAEDGTQKHTAVENIVKSPESVDTLLDQIPKLAPDLSDEQIPAVEQALTAIQKVFDTYDIDFFEIEPFVEIIPDIAGGSIDLLGFSSDGETAVIVDYKFGHLTVRAEESAQHLFYHICADADPRFQPLYDKASKIVNVVIQPNDDGEVIDAWEAPIDVLDAFSDSVYAAIEAAQAPNPQPTSGNWCRFCPARAVCPILTGAAQKALTLDAQNRATLIDAMQLIQPLGTWIKAVEKLAHEQMELGLKIPGYKLVAKRPVRKWDDEAEVLKLLKAKRSIKYLDACDIKVKSPAQMEKFLKSIDKDPDMFKDHITALSSGSVIAPETDKRPELLPVEAIKQISQKLN